MRTPKVSLDEENATVKERGKKRKKRKENSQPGQNISQIQSTRVSKLHTPLVLHSNTEEAAIQLLMQHWKLTSC
jgi:hypothetical protein